MSVLGNLLVVFSVMCFRNLRQPPNILLLALAVTDLCVSLIVMPGALLQEMVGEWPLSSGLCVGWVFADVFLCTSSILSLTAICIDRYLAISRPLLYVPVRTPRLIWCWILAVNILAGLVSAPVFPAWNNETSDYQEEIERDWDLGYNETNQDFVTGLRNVSQTTLCLVPQSPIYQLYATIVAFYLPLTVIIILNTQIYIIARRIISREKKSPCLSRHFLVANPSVVETSKKRLALNPGKLKVSSKKNGSTKQKKDKIEAEIPTTCSNMYSEYQEKDDVLCDMYGDKRTDFSSANYVGHQHLSSSCKSVSVLNACQVLRLSDTSYCIKLAATKDNQGGTKTMLSTVAEQREKEALLNKNERPNDLELANNSQTRKLSRKWTAQHKKVLEDKFEQEFKQFDDDSPVMTNNGNIFVPKKNYGREDSNFDGLPKSPSGRLTKYFSGSGYARQEWKATLTVAIVVLTFLICWLPFFVLALVRPLAPQVKVPDWVSALTLWLGYTNSMLNPIIYGVLHRDFRKTFVEILSCKVFKDYFRAYNLKN